MIDPSTHRSVRRLRQGRGPVRNRGMYERLAPNCRSERDQSWPLSETLRARAKRVILLQGRRPPGGRGLKIGRAGYGDLL